MVELRRVTRLAAMGMGRMASCLKAWSVGSRGQIHLSHKGSVGRKGVLRAQLIWTVS